MRLSTGGRNSARRSRRDRQRSDRPGREPGPPGAFRRDLRASPKGGCVRLDFVLKDPDPDAPLVAANLWATTEEDHEQAFAEGKLLVDFMADKSVDFTPGLPSDTHVMADKMGRRTVRLTFVWVQPVISQISA